MKIAVTILYVFLLCVMLLTIAQAQPGLPSAPQQAPIDGGLSLLALAGGGYAMKKLRDKKNDSDENLNI